MERNFTAAESWLGGFYERSMEFQFAHEGLEAALQALWDSPGLQGCYLRRDVEPAQQVRVAPSLVGLRAHGHLLGIATIPNRKPAACGTCLVREENGSDWLTFYLPLGALEAAYPVGAYPFDNALSSRVWREPLESWLAGVGQAVFARTAFRVGMIGFEVSGTINAQELGEVGIPEQRFIGYLYPEASRLNGYPTNRWHDPSPRPIKELTGKEQSGQTEGSHAPRPD